MIKISTKEIGDYGENVAAHYLKKLGYKILRRNYREKWGEIDIIASQGELIVCVEVKANRNISMEEFAPERRVNQKKLMKIMKTAMLYIEYTAKSLETPFL